MDLSVPENSEKEHVFEAVQNYLDSLELHVVAIDKTRPWGGFYVNDETLASNFIEQFFPSLDKKNIPPGQKLSPKILIVAPGKRLSWQYHFRRSELWKIIGGTAGVAKSDGDTEQETIHFKPGDIIQLKQGERHRLIGLNEWGIVAEIWQHTDATNPSDEEDIIILQDDFGR